MKRSEPPLWRDILEILAGMVIFGAAIWGVIWVVRACAPEAFRAERGEAEL